MSVNPHVAAVAGMATEPSRAAMLTILLDGRRHTAGELASMAGIKPQTASFHLAKMVAADVVAVSSQGRHRYYGIRSAEVAGVMESLLSIARPVQIRSLRQSTEDRAIRHARTCYDHLAGSVGVQVTDALLRMGALADEQDRFVLTEDGERFLARFGIDMPAVRRQRRSFLHKCLDWSERYPHLGGALGHALLERLLFLQWIERQPDTRAVRVTPAGIQGLRETFGVALEQAAAPR
ncbi:ArsR/SmtB family transcription factor [Cohnella nanjingensis]|uniref:Winged helix-turn-helix transcriptional regulator n=1 Tax=Cohnella nanjingensis TaxID=1387779 RepID=A0A7X0VIL1_9BACL|nr:winged helix-turn-helix domain-containing protein [Cohnella nanjingensis]MBB6674663.1 winged helix-turn-helix transcriptional regulator [Cohnella nanjingensis]